MNYRLYIPEDFAELYAIEEICFEPQQRFARGYMRHIVESIDAATWIAEDDGRMAGFAIVDWVDDGGGTIAYIQTIEVAPEWRGRGVGDELMWRMERSAWVAGAQNIRLHVDAENAVAIRLYEARGFRHDGREEDYYARGRAALIYAKALGDARDR